MFTKNPLYQRLVIISAHNKHRNGFRKSRTDLFWDFKIMTFFFFFIKIEAHEQREEDERDEEQ